MLFTYLRATVNDLALLPKLVSGYFVSYEILEVLIEFSHEKCSWGNAIGVESGLLGYFHALGFCLLLQQFGFLGSPEASASLLIYLGTRSHSIDGHEEQLLRLYCAK